MTFAAPAPRLVLGAPLAAIITLSLAMLMQALIAQRNPPPLEPPRQVDIQITSEIIDNPPPTRERPQEPVDVPTPPPTVISKPAGETVDGGMPRFVVDLPPIEPLEDLGRVGLSTLPPQLIFTPVLQYPQRMYPREGSCSVAFDITEAGATTNVRARSCTNSGFRSAAEAAVRRFQYKPAQGEHGAVASPGHAAEVVFTIDE